MKELNVKNFNTSNVTDMTAMFEECVELNNIDLSNFNTSNVTSMRSMFAYCIELDDLDLSSFNTSKVTNMEDMFRQCEQLTSLNLDNFDTSEVTNIKHMFLYCSGLVDLNLSKFDTSKVTNMSGLFQGCPNIKSENLNIMNWNVENVTDFTNTFEQMSAPEYIKGWKTLDISNWEIPTSADTKYMFRGNFDDALIVYVKNEETKNRFQSEYVTSEVQFFTK